MAIQVVRAPSAATGRRLGALPVLVATLVTVFRGGVAPRPTLGPAPRAHARLPLRPEHLEQDARYAHARQYDCYAGPSHDWCLGLSASGAMSDPSGTLRPWIEMSRAHRPRTTGRARCQRCLRHLRNLRMHRRDLGGPLGREPFGGELRAVEPLGAERLRAVEPLAAERQMAQICGNAWTQSLRNSASVGLALARPYVQRV